MYTRCPPSPLHVSPFPRLHRNAAFFFSSTNFGKDKGGKGGKKGKGEGVRGRMKEQEEDKLLLATAASKARVTRLSKQPSLIK